jgi:hypothetical protein
MNCSEIRLENCPYGNAVTHPAGEKTCMEVKSTVVCLQTQTNGYNFDSDTETFFVE